MGASQESVHPNPPVMLEECQPWLLVLPMVSPMAKMVLCLNHQGPLVAYLPLWLDPFSLVLELVVVPISQCPYQRLRICDVWSCYPNSRPLQQVYASTLWLLWIRN